MGTYRVMRQDDNGNRFVVAGDLDRAEAQRLAAEFEARGHKQLYWVEALGATEAAEAAEPAESGNGGPRNA
ncbi:MULTISPECIES: SPOR domain-containing protein [unclassified Kitasatospora]|uniref:SPOR domain-containing protein n=1 Tax=unclassified Kitasatospora TaxID=2633591 RepID=UPI0033F6AB50